MNIRKMVSAVLGVMGSALCLSQAQAQAPTLTTLGAATLLTSTTSINQAAIDATGATAFTANMYSAVYRETTNTLTFVYQFKVVGGPDAVETFSANNFSGFTTALFEDRTDARPFGTPGVPVGATNAFMNTSGSTVDFTYNPTGVSNPNFSYLLVVRTNATNFKAGSMNLQDGANITVGAFAPAVAVPEPGTYAAFAFTGVGMMGLMLRARKSRGSMVA